MAPRPVLALLLPVAVLCSGSPLAPTRLRVEYLDRPLAIDVPSPRFSYAISHPDRGQAQTAYQMMLSTDGKPLWDSGVVRSNQTTNIPYPGPALASDTDYQLSVRWTDASGQLSAWGNSSFSTGLLDPSVDFAGAEFISGGPSMLRAQFTVPGPAVRARLYIIGLGYYKSYLNGRATDAHVLGPFTTFEQRLLYDTWDVTDLVQPGCNSLGVLLGNGWYALGGIQVGPKSLMALLSVTTPDGKRHLYPTKVSGDPTSDLLFSAAESPVVSDDIFQGEVYDARLEQPGWTRCGFDAAGWKLAGAAAFDPIKNGSVVNARTVQIEVDESYPVVNVTQLEIGGDFVIDFGQNMAGLLTINVVCPVPGTSIHMHFGESLHPDGSVLNQYGNIMNANYTCTGNGELESYTTLFAYYGFRFVQVTNFPGVPNEASFMAHFIHSNVPQTGSLSTNNHLLNQIQHATRYASMSNLMDVPTDCPQRERRGWLGDAQLSCEMAIHNFDMGAFYTKWMRDIKDSQAHHLATAKGAIPDCVPYYGHGALPADPAWSAAYPLITQWVSEYYADDRIVAEHYDGIKMYMDSQITQLDKATGLLSFAHYGDWCSVSDGPSTGAGFLRPSISTFYFTKGLDALVDFAHRLDKQDDAALYSALADKTRKAFQSLLYNSTTHSYEDGYPISQIMAFMLGVVPAAEATDVFSSLHTALSKGTHSGLPNAPTGGIVFTKYFWDLLKEHGQNGLGIDYMLAKGMPSFSAWLDPDQGVGATTLWENWQSTPFNPHGSYNQ